MQTVLNYFHNARDNGNSYNDVFLTSWCLYLHFVTRLLRGRHVVTFQHK